MLAMPDRLSDPPRAKRNSGRTGRRRMTAAQAALSGQHAVADHRRRYGQQGPTSVMPALPGPPAWFSPELIEIWRATVGAAPQGMLAGVDYANLIAYCVAVDMHHRLARQ